MSHRMNEIKPAHHVTKEECQKMIDDAKVEAKVQAEQLSARAKEAIENEKLANNIAINSR